MNSKILKYELFLNFFLTMFIFILLLAGDKGPDSYLTISSNQDSSFFSYYFFSFLGFVNYYTGKWIILLFALQVVLYISCTSKRADVFDNLLIVPLILASVLFIFYLSPSYLGSGLYQYLNNEFSSVALFLMLAASLVLLGMGIFREKFFAFFKSISSLKLAEYLSNYKDRIKKVASNSDRLIEEKFSTFGSSSVSDKEEDVGKNTTEESKMTSDQSLLVIENCSVIKEGVDIHSELSSSSPLNGDLIEVEPCESSSSLIDHPKFNDEAYYGIVNTVSSKKVDARLSNPDDRYFQDIINKIHSKLAEFKIEGKIINVLKGPVVDTFEWELGVGEKISKLTSAAEDLSLALLGAPIRMVYPMKGRGTVGIEVPRSPREIIFLDEIINSKEYISSSYHLPLAMGKDAFGEPVVVDLASMPHMLVAGSTGAGKSVFINSILMSLLIKKSPSQMKLILVDPKQLELALYARLPHLIMPVITDAKTASVALLWAVQEMERRYSIMTQLGVRNIEGFNHKLKRAEPSHLESLRKFYEYETEDTYELPYIVVIVDEFADLILTASGKDIETNICRLAAKARAAGIHLVIATQRPSVDVITGLIKSNFPTRVSFRVTSPQDSRTILNAMGAEKLLGKGDMLYKYGVDTTRIHSSYVEEEDIEELTDKLAGLGLKFNEHVMEFLENGGEEENEIIISGNSDIGASGQDEKYDEAVRVVIEHRSASASLLQRRLGVGYNRAANLIEEMEAKGVVGPAQGSKPRKVLLGSEGIN